MKKSAKIVISVLLLFAIIPIATVPSSAMTPLPPTVLLGNHARGTRFPTESGILIENQSITYNLSELPDYEDDSATDRYSGSVTTEYSLYNPTEQDITLKLSYIMDRAPGESYYTERETEVSKYSLMINGETVQPSVRHGLFLVYQSTKEASLFDIIQDEYIDDGYCGPDMTITKYTFKQSGVTEEHAKLGFNIHRDDSYGRCFYLGKDSYTSSRIANTVGLRMPAVENGSTFEVYVFGNDLDDFPEWTVYTAYYDESETTEGKIELIGKETLSFSEYVFSYYDTELGISEVDFFNMAAGEMSTCINSAEGLAPLDKLHNSFKDFAVTGYIYEITIPAGERLVHTAVAPAYPTIETAMEPRTYEYNYDFYTENAIMFTGNIDIKIITPYYLINNDHYAFEKTEDGYSLSLTPIEKIDEYSHATHGGVFFTLCESENPEKVETNFGALVIILIIILIPVFIIGGAIKLISDGISFVINLVSGAFR